MVSNQKKTIRTSREDRWKVSHIKWVRPVTLVSSRPRLGKGFPSRIVHPYGSGWNESAGGPGRQHNTGRQNRPRHRRAYWTNGRAEDGDGGSLDRERQPQGCNRWRSNPSSLRHGRCVTGVCSTLDGPLYLLRLLSAFPQPPEYSPRSGEASSSLI